MHRRREGADLAARAKKGAAARWKNDRDDGRVDRGDGAGAANGDTKQDTGGPEVSGSVSRRAPVRPAESVVTAGGGRATAMLDSEPYHCRIHRIRDPKCGYCQLGG